MTGAVIVAAAAGGLVWYVRHALKDIANNIDRHSPSNKGEPQ